LHCIVGLSLTRSQPIPGHVVSTRISKYQNLSRTGPRCDQTGHLPEKEGRVPLPCATTTGPQHLLAGPFPIKSKYYDLARSPAARCHVNTLV
jgi:hypothetical protein